MFQAPGSSPRRPGSAVGEGSSDLEASRNRENSRGQTPREYYQPRFRRPPPRHVFKNMSAIPSNSYLPQPHISDHGRWDVAGFSGAPRFVGGGGGCRRGTPDKDQIDFHNLPILRQPPKSFGDNHGDSNSNVDKISDEKYRSQLRSFPDLPQVAHDRIREFGNEIVACYAAQLCKFLNDALIETAPSSFAVFTTKNRTGQRWLMVFKSERGRVSVSYNKLLTNQLLVRCLNNVSVEIEPIRGMCTIPQENCVFTFPSHTEATKFVSDIHESQTILWNHREMIVEQQQHAMRPHHHHHPDFYMEPPAFGYYSPRPLSARASAGYLVLGPEIPPPLTPRMRVLSSGQHRHKRSPFTVSARTPRADFDENWRGLAEEGETQEGSNGGGLTPTPGSVISSPIRKRSKGSSKDGFQTAAASIGGGDGDFVYNSLTHALALQQNSGIKTVSSQPEVDSEAAAPVDVQEDSKSRFFQATDILVSNKRDVGTGAPDEEFFSLGPGQVQFVDNGDDQFDEIKAVSSTSGQVLFSQILFGWNKVRHAEGGSNSNPNLRWWMGAAVLGSKTRTGEAPRIREFKGTFVDEETANKFSQLFQAGVNKGNNPEVRKKYVAQSLKKDRFS